MSANTNTNTTPVRVKNQHKVRAGQLGAASRWGPRRHVRLDTLTPEQRAIVLALVEASKQSTPAA